MTNPLDVELRQTTAPCAEWCVYLRKMGGYLHVKSFAQPCRSVATVYATELAGFLGVPVVLPPEVPTKDT